MVLEATLRGKTTGMASDWDFWLVASLQILILKRPFCFALVFIQTPCGKSLTKSLTAGLKLNAQSVLDSRLRVLQIKKKKKTLTPKHLSLYRDQVGRLSEPAWKDIVSNGQRDRSRPVCVSRDFGCLLWVWTQKDYQIWQQLCWKNPQKNLQTWCVPITYCAVHPSL